MEQKTVLAVVLSILVLWMWAALVPKPQVGQPQSTPRDVSQPIDIKEDTIERQPVQLSEQTTITPSSTPSVEEITQHIATEGVTVEFTNIGGNIKSITLNRYKHTLPITKLASVPELDAREFTSDIIDPHTITYSLSDNNIAVKKTYNINQENNLITCDVAIQNTSPDPIAKTMLFNALTIDHTDKEQPTNPRDRSLMEYSVAHDSGILRKGNAFQFSSKYAAQDFGIVKWAGFRDRYFCALVKPTFRTARYQAEPIGKQQLSLSYESDKAMLEPGASAIYSTQIVVSPQDIDLLKSYNAGFEDIIAYSSVGLLNAIAHISDKLLKLIHSVVPNWGICIILMGILVYVAMSPLTMKGMYSMKRMQALQPQMTKIREQYKNNPQRLNKEIMELYKENKVNPFGGCFPLLLQMPVFIGLYQALWRSVAFKGASFLWIKDLSEPDRLLILPTNLPIIGNELNILPIIMAIVMYVQQKITTKNMPATDPNQVAQQRMMTLFFPIFLGFLFYKFASGLALYFTVFYVLSIFTQLRMSKVAKVT